MLDLARGTAVHAQAGDRPRYQPVESALVPGSVGDPVALLRAFGEVLGAAQCYVADLDAIQGGAIQCSLIRRLANLASGRSGSLLVDAGTHEAAGTRELLACGAGAAVVGLESLRSFADLAAIVELVGPDRVVFSLDLRLGSPIVHPTLHDASGAAPDALGLAGQAVAAGVSSLLVLDLGRIGTGCGLDLGLLKALRRRFPRQRLLAGGGVLTRRDLDRMRDAGCDGALLASAIHTGRIGAADVAALARPAMRRGQSETNASR